VTINIQEVAQSVFQTLKKQGISPTNNRFKKSDESTFLMLINIFGGADADIEAIRKEVLMKYGSNRSSSLWGALVGRFAQILREEYFVYDSAGTLEIYRRAANKKGFVLELQNVTWSSKRDFANVIILRKGVELADIKQYIEAHNATAKSGERASLIDTIIAILDNIFSDPANRLPARPVPFSTDETEPTCYFIELPTLVDAPTPYFDQFLTRLESALDVEAAKYFMAFVWSIFELKDRNRVLLYLYGGGNDGKSVIISTISSLIQDITVNAIFGEDSKHATAAWYDKRLLINSEATKINPAALSSVKQITGGDPIKIEPKGRDAFTVKVNCKIICISNEVPVVSLRSDEASRLLPIGVRALTIPRSDLYIDKIKAELPAFLFRCKKAYGELRASKADKLGSGFLSIESALRGSIKYKDFAASFIEEIRQVYELRTVEREDDQTTRAAARLIFQNLLASGNYKHYAGKFDLEGSKFLFCLDLWAKDCGSQFLPMPSTPQGKSGFKMMQLVRKGEVVAISDISKYI
jgi:hypothetical protein